MRFRTKKLPNGAGLAVAEMPHVESVTLGLWLRVGGRHEGPGVGGVSHFIEHMLFKGTRQRSAREISEAVEGVGGYLNAFTAEEMTCYFAKASAKHLPRVADVLADMLANATFPGAEITRERGVIIEEIRMYEDQPQQVAMDQLNALLWPGHALGRPLAGTVEGIAKLKRADMLAHKRRFYHAGNLWVTLAGKTSLEESEALLWPVLKKLPKGRAARVAAPLPLAGRPRISLTSKPIEQTHLMIGLRGVSRHDERRYALRLLNVILGENMSSRLFQVIREEHGLAYSIHSMVNYLSDCGALLISAGVENGKAAEALALTLKTLKQLAQKGPGKVELQRAKEYTIGQIDLSLESTTNQMIWMGENLMGHRKIFNPADVTGRVAAVTAAEIRALAGQLTRNRNLAVAVVGPDPDEKAFRQAARF
ncbi:MAG: pitrilysin family protein [Verrucomicrobiota bacterium]